MVLDDESNAKLWQRNDYHAFGMHINQPVDGVPTPELIGINDRYYNGKEYDDQTTWLDYGARQYDYSLGRWMAVDPMAQEYFGTSPYVFVLNRPTVSVDTDGRRVYFIGGAGNDQDGWNYINRWGKAFKKSGINFYRVNASHGTSGDIAFTNLYRDSGFENDTKPPSTQNIVSGLSPAPYQYSTKTHPVSEATLDATVSMYKKQLKDNPLKEGEQFNLAGYSYGSVLQAQAALKLASSGQVIDNLILIGSPISDKSDLWKQLNSNKNIKNVIRYDIKGDLLSNPQDIYDFIQGGIQNKSDDGPHFNAARPGQQANQLIQTIIQWLQQQGVKN
jgi:RHS repeat-associated protein